MIELKAGKEKNLLKHHPWVFSGALEEVSLPTEAGIQKVVSSEGRFVAWGWYDKDSHIVLRLLSWDEDQYPNNQWFEKTIRESILRRASFFADKTSGTNVFRIIHGEADMLPGVACDVYGKIVRLVISARIAWDLRQVFVNTIESLLHPQMIIINTDSAFCSIEKLHEVMEYYKEGVKFSPSEKLEQIQIRESGIYYGLIPGGGQKSGFYCDQRENRLRLETYAKDATVLDGCCYTGGFTLHALRGGAKSVHSYDSSSDAIHRLLSNVNLNEEMGTIPQGSRDKVVGEKGDIFEVLRNTKKDFYDLI
ncbi:MAG: class I SAM-dependent methyltransferase, partial [Sphaerochaetaceae bacterium]|nr:class I SAM-dependent methyltransferase [Sphaerochaetaceae bacterium]